MGDIQRFLFCWPDLPKTFKCGSTKYGRHLKLKLYLFTCLGLDLLLLLFTTLPIKLLTRSSSSSADPLIA